MASYEISVPTSSKPADLLTYIQEQYESLQWILANLDEENFTEEYSSQLSSLKERISALEERISALENK